MELNAYSKKLFSNLENILKKNQDSMVSVVDKMVENVINDRYLLIFGSGHSALFPMEMYHRAGGFSYVIPLVADYLIPTAGPPLTRFLERTPGAASILLARAQPKSGEMLWIASQSGINGAVVDFALEAKRYGLETVAFTSLDHSKAVESRHPSGKRLFEVCDHTVDLGGYRGDAAVEIKEGLSAGAVSGISAAFLGHTILVEVSRILENRGIRCTYTSVNTPEGANLNKQLEMKASIRDPLLRG